MPQGPPRLLHQLVEQVAAATPDTPAVITADGEVSYGELWEQAGGFAQRLVESGAGPGSLIGLCAAPSTALFSGMLGILRAGAAYLPLDPSYPPRRVEQILAAARPLAVAVGPGSDELGSVLASQTCLEIAPDSRSAHAGGDGAAPEDPAYVIFTSGSTGQPKGVVVEHRNAVWSTLARHELYAEHPPKRFLLLSSIAFDSSVAGIFWTLSIGGTLIAPPRDEIADPERLARGAAATAITHLLTVPTLYAELVERLEHEELSTVIVAGEECPAALVERHHRAHPKAALFNEYGPTETTVWATACQLAPGEIVSLGSPVPGAHVSLRDSSGNPVPDGERGEIWIGGEGVTRGYLDRPELTRERFVQDPWDSQTTLYRTGDLGRVGAGGRIEFLGRADAQVQVGGVRVELGEIEATLLEHEEVAAAVAVFVADERGPGTITVHVVPRPGGTIPAVTELRQWVASRLPSAMVPAFVEVQETLPTLPNGKVDRASLSQAAAPAAESRPLTAGEELVAQLWHELLDLPDGAALNPGDNFFALGGHSLMLMRLRHGIAERTGVDLGLRKMMADPTVAGLAANIELAGAEAKPA